MIIDTLGYTSLFVFCLLVCTFIVVALVVYLNKSVIEIRQMRLDLERDKQHFN